MKVYVIIQFFVTTLEADSEDAEDSDSDGPFAEDSEEGEEGEGEARAHLRGGKF